MHLRAALIFAVALAPTAGTSAVELVSITPATYDEYVPEGKETDAIYGDYALRNQDVVAIIGDPIPSRKANMMTRASGGCIIDLTARDFESDQLGTYYPFPTGRPMEFRGIEVDGRPVDVEDRYAVDLQGDTITLIMHASATNLSPSAFVRYTLSDGQPYISIETEHRNSSDEALTLRMSDSVRMDQSGDQIAVSKGPDSEQDHFWLYDPFFGQAYAIFDKEGMFDVKSGSGGRAATALGFIRDGATERELAPGASYTTTRHIAPARTLIEARAVMNEARGIEQSTAKFYIRETGGRAIADAEIDLTRDGEPYAFGTTRRNGRLDVQLPAGDYTAKIVTLGSGEKSLPFRVASDDTELTVEMPSAGRVALDIHDIDGGPIPCKVQFYGLDGTDDPFFGPDTGIYGIHNVRYSVDGRFEQVVTPGKYQVVISRGNEYDAIFRDINVGRGETVTVSGTLRRTVDTNGWISTEYHSHSTPSGDNTSHQRGRVLNLLAEHIEFAPATEHSRIESYVDHLRYFEAEDLMATVSGMELTGSPGDLNHQNAFPLKAQPRTQDGGAPQTLGSPEEQIELLAKWDDESEKLVQQNHPDMAEMFFDRDNDGNRDRGYNRMISYMDVIEVHPPAAIFWHPFTDTLPPGSDPDKPRRNRMSTWVQMFNIGMGVPGVSNTDAHYNFHGSGWYRNYIPSATDDPKDIDPMEMVRASKRGQIVMTNGPYLEVEIRNDENSDPKVAGDTLVAEDGKIEVLVRVQCANWLDVDRVQVLANGRYREDLNFTRATHPDYFRDGTIKFEQRFTLDLAEDTHFIVATIGEESALGPVYGNRRGAMNPVAVSNPIFVDIDGNGFTPNGDLLNRPLVPPIN